MAQHQRHPMYPADVPGDSIDIDDMEFVHHPPDRTGVEYSQYDYAQAAWEQELGAEASTFLESFKSWFPYRDDGESRKLSTHRENLWRLAGDCPQGWNAGLEFMATRTVLTEDAFKFLKDGHKRGYRRHGVAWEQELLAAASTYLESFESLFEHCDDSGSWKLSTHWENLWRLAGDCPQGWNAGLEFMATRTGFSGDAFKFLEGRHEGGYEMEGSGSGTKKSFTGINEDADMAVLGSKPNTDSPLMSFMLHNKLSLCESAPGSRWPQRLSVQRNSGFAGGGVSGLRRDAVNARTTGGGSRIAVPPAMQAALAASKKARESETVGEKRGGYFVFSGKDGYAEDDDDLEYFSVEEELEEDPAAKS